MLLHYLGWLKIRIFCIYLAHVEENANKLQFKCTNFNSSMRVTVYLCVFIKLLFWSLNTMLIVDKHCCDEFPVPHSDHKSKQVKEWWHGKFYLQSVWGKLAILNTKNKKKLWMNNKGRGDRNAICLHFLPCAPNISRNLHFSFPKVV